MLFIKVGLASIVAYILMNIFIPGIPFWEQTSIVLEPIFVAVPLWLFTFFTNLAEHSMVILQATEQPAETFFYLLLFLGCIALAFVSVITWFVFLIYILILVFSGPVMRAALRGSTCDIDLRNEINIINGRTTVQEMFDAEVQAIEIAKEIKK